MEASRRGEWGGYLSQCVPSPLASVTTGIDLASLSAMPRYENETSNFRRTMLRFTRMMTTTWDYTRWYTHTHDRTHDRLAVIVLKGNLEILLKLAVCRWFQSRLVLLVRFLFSSYPLYGISSALGSTMVVQSRQKKKFHENSTSQGGKEPNPARDISPRPVVGETVVGDTVTITAPVIIV